VSPYRTSEEQSRGCRARMLRRAFFTTADILSLTAFVVSHFRAIHDRGIDEGLNHEQSDLCRQTAA
jgi:hypothetical protein